MLAGSPEPESKWIEAHGARLHYLDWGGESKQPALLLHGLQDCAGTWNYFARDLADQFHVFALDHRGHGDSAWTDTYGLEDYVQELHEVIEGLDLRNLVMIGHSAGGKNSFIEAARHPDRLSKLVIVDMDPDAYNPGSATMFDRYRTESDDYESLDAVIERLRSRQPESSEEVLRHCAVALTKPGNNRGLTWKRDRDLVLKYERPDAWGYLPQITVPTLIVRGSESTLLTRPVAERMRDAIPGSELAEVGGGAHWAFLEQSEVFSQMMLGHLVAER